jgi:hypothetical protein
MVDAIGIKEQQTIHSYKYVYIYIYIRIFSFALSFTVISCRSHRRGQGEIESTAVLCTKFEWRLDQVPITHQGRQLQSRGC